MGICFVGNVLTESVDKIIFLPAGKLFTHFSAYLIATHRPQSNAFIKPLQEINQTSWRLQPITGFILGFKEEKRKMSTFFTYGGSRDPRRVRESF